MPGFDALRDSASAIGVPGYAPSLAPSERSSVGQPSRYRVVTNENRSKTMNAHSSMPDLTLIHRRSRSPLKSAMKKSDPDLSVDPQHRSNPLIYSNFSNSASLSNLSTTIRAVSKPKNGYHPGADDDEDEEGWAELRNKKEARKSRWRLNKSKDDERSDFKGGLEGLLYDG